jgi:2-amino-4-hydroxy-6-hydroxymethyldihydropteridine diphosphokinase
VILIGIGSNLAAPPALTPRATAEAGLAALSSAGIGVVALSRWYASEPVPVSSQPWFVNGVAIVASDLSPAALLERMLAVEVAFGRLRGVANAARTLDLDLLDHEARLCDDATLVLPHPRMHLRRFVLAPLCELAPSWRHPRLGLNAAELLARLPPGQPVTRLDR